MPEKVIITYKKLGQTPLETLEEARKEHAINPEVPMTYAGRLDPMAEGLLILLVGDECKEKDKYLGLDKTYEFEILVGFETDTYDLLGQVSSSNAEDSNNFSGPRTSRPIYVGGPDHSKSFDSSSFSLYLQEFTGTFMQKYPAYSSKTVGGKQLHSLSRDGELPDDLPEHEVTITRLEVIGDERIHKADLMKEIQRRINLVSGDFRQDLIKGSWIEAMSKSDAESYQILRLVCDCSSGTYIRQLVSDLGQRIGLPMVTYSIKRTKVGDYTIDDIGKI